MLTAASRVVGKYDLLQNVSIYSRQTDRILRVDSSNDLLNSFDGKFYIVRILVIVLKVYGYETCVKITGN